MIDFGDGIVAREAPAAGDKVLWIHGYTLDASTWQPLWAQLPEWHHIGIELPGHGISRPFDPQQTLPELARQLGEHALELGVKHLVALSFGGQIALQIAIEFPNAFERIVLGAPGMSGGPQDPSVMLLYKKMARVYFERGRGPWLTDMWMESKPFLFKGAFDQPELWQSLYTIIDRYSWDEIASGAMRGLTSGKQLPEQLQQISAETIILVGDEEMRAFQLIAERLERYLPNCRRIFLPGVSHLCLLQVPDIAAGYIRQHLEEAHHVVH